MCVFYLKKAFDCVDHSILLMKLPYYGIQYEALQWFVNYLQDRSQRVCAGGLQSELKKLPSIGVPQGSVLGLVLFMLYVNDLPGVIKCSEVSSYADDTQPILLLSV